MYIPVAKIDNFFTTDSWKDESKVIRYTKALLKGEIFPPISVEAEEDGRYTVYDGHHRLEAHRRAGIDQIKAKT